MRMHDKFLYKLNIAENFVKYYTRKKSQNITNFSILYVSILSKIFDTLEYIHIKLKNW
jgi:hypothetical protein